MGISNQGIIVGSWSSLCARGVGDGMTRRRWSVANGIGLAAGVLLAALVAGLGAMGVATGVPQPAVQVAVTAEATDNVFVGVQPLRFRVQVKNPSDGPVEGALQAVLKNSHSLAVTSSLAMTVAAHSTSVRSLVLGPMSKYGLYSLEDRWVAAGNPNVLTASRTQRTTVAVVPVPKFDAGDRFGLNANLTPVAADPADLQSALTTMRTEGIGWYRLEFDAAMIATLNSGSHWGPTDAVLRQARKAHLHILGLLTAWPAGANPFGPSPGLTFAQGLEAYSRFVRATVARYMPDGSLARSQGWKHYGITAWELWNEPTTAAYWPGTAAQYAELAQVAAAAIHALEPKATVLAYADAPKTLLTTDSPPAFNAISWHYYPGPSSPDDPVTSVYAAMTPVSMAKQMAASVKAQTLPLWLTEMGWSTDWVSSQEQAAYWVRGAIDALAEGNRKVFFFTESYPGSGYGEVKGDGQPTLTVPAVAALTYVLQGYQPAGKVELGSGIQAWLWQRDGKGLATLWGSGSASGTLAITAREGAIHAVDWLDNPIVEADPNLVRIPIGPTPVYLTGRHLSAQMLAQILRQGVLSGIPAVSLQVSSSLAVEAGRVEPFTVTITNQKNTPVSGRLLVTLPAGWKPVTFASHFGSIRPGANSEIVVPVTRVRTDAKNAYTTILSAFTGTGPPLIEHAEASLLAGPPTADASAAQRFAVRLNRRSQVTGIPGWSTAVAHATLYPTWTNLSFDLVATVHTQAFAEPYSDANIWQGSSLQLYFQPRTARKGGHSNNPMPAGIGLALTPVGPEVYEWNGPSPGLLTRAELQVSAIGPHAWRYAAQIPWSALGIDPGPGTAFGFDVLLNVVRHGQRDGWLALAPGVGNTNLPSEYPTFTLLSAGEADRLG